MTLWVHYFLTLIGFVFAKNPHLKSPLYTVYNVAKITYMASKYQPTFAPCKYGAQFAFDQPHFITVPQAPFKKGRKGCCDMCELFPTTLRSGAVATMCCMPNTPHRHGAGAHSFGGDDDNNPLVYLNHPLRIVFDSIVPGNMKMEDYRRWVNKGSSEPRAGTGAWAYAFLGAAAAQTIVLILVAIFYRMSHQRIGLETVADCDYEIEQEVKVFHPSKSAMMSDNMNSDLMSMQAGP